jgi:hypothetical protein
VKPELVTCRTSPKKFLAMKSRVCIILFLSLTVLSSGRTFAQSSFVFKVLGVSGTVKKQTSEGLVALTIGSKLNSDESIVIESGYCGLMHNSGKGMELKSPGSYSVNDLSQNFKAGARKGKVSEKYVNYVMGQLTKDEAEDINSNHRKYMEVTGSVERTSTNYRIKLIALNSNEVLGKSYTLNWTSNVKDAEYLLEVSNLFNEVVFTAKTKENSAAVDFGPLFYRHGKNLIVSVRVTGKQGIKSREYTFKQASENVVADLGLSNEKNSVSYMVNGMICEEHNLFMDALAFYREASTSENAVEGYKTAYQNLFNLLVGR